MLCRPTFKTERLRPARRSCKIAYQRGGPKSAPVPSWASWLSSFDLAGYEFSERHVRLFAPPAWLRRRRTKLCCHKLVFRTRTRRSLESLILRVPLFSQRKCFRARNVLARGFCVFAVIVPAVAFEAQALLFMRRFWISLHDAQRSELSGFGPLDARAR